MNAPNTWIHEDEGNDLDYRSMRVREKSNEAPQGSRKQDFRTKKRPVSMNGIHRRRNKRWSW
ncbi:MAG: hypothetical protein SFX18_13235 [Pirellulales bacterium]|nr:hypothetical protein [Pirellulales bacterium]